MFRSMFSRRALLAVAIVNRRTVSSVPLQSSRRWLHSSLSRFEAPGFVDETTRSEMTHTGRVHKPEHLDKASSADGRYGFATVMDILKWKTDRNQPQLISTSSNTNVLVSLQKMHKNNVGALIITHPETDAMVGIITASDYRRLRDDKQTHSLTVADVMTDARDTITCLPTTSLMRCISLMEENHLHHIPVVEEDGRVCGLIAKRDIVWPWLAVPTKEDAGAHHSLNPEGIPGM